MFKPILLVAALLGSSLAHAGWDDDVRRAHIEAHLPPEEVFESYLRRDIVARFKSMPDPGVTRAEFAFLRQGATQSGVAYPKWYLWTKVYAGNALRYEGALRVAAVERTHFQVTDFVPKADIRAGKVALQKIFPALLVPAIMDLARAPASPRQNGKVLDKKIQ